MASIVFDHAADFYDETRGLPPAAEEPIARLLVRAGNLQQDSQVLEIGIGTGRIALPLARQIGAVFGIDLSLPMMLRLREKQSVEIMHLALADASRIPFTSQGFDAIVIVHVLHLIDDLRPVLAELGRIIRPGGTLLHCGGRNDAMFDVIRDAWRHALGQSNVATDSRWLRSKSILDDNGWTKVETVTQDYAFSKSPQIMLEQFQNRVWSSTWALSDADVERGVAAIKQVISQQFSDPHAPIEMTGSFDIEVYNPPLV